MRLKTGRLSAGCIAATLVLASVAAVGATPASATTPCTGDLNHCYTYVDSGTSPQAEGTPPIYIRQVGADLEADCLAVKNPDPQQQRHASWEMWVVTNISSSGRYPANPSWLEAGLANIALNGGPAGFGWFWAEKTPSGSYHQDWISSAAEDQRRNVTFSYVGGGSWNVAWNGTVVATPGDNTGNAGDVQVGAELAGDNKGQVNAHAWNWQYEPLSGGAWRSAVVSKTGYYPNNPANYSLSWGADPGTGLLDVTVHTTGNSQQCGDTVLKAQAVSARAGTAHWTASPAALRQVTATTIAAHASGHATSATVVRTTRRAATALTHETFVGPGSAASVYLVQATGAFTEQVSSPYGTVAEHGNAVSMVIDARTGQVLDWAILRKASNLRALGKVSALPS